jgi:cysteinyl-tRNA synthetase
MLSLWNTLHRKVELFEPIRSGEIGLYTCGPTVYNPVTLGNMRTYLFEDFLKRALTVLGYRVKHVMNITDVGHLANDSDDGEDKVAREAEKRGVTAWDIAREYEEIFLKNLEQLQILPCDVRPHATAHIPEQIALIQRLEEKGFAYRTSDGLYFDTARFPEYGKLSGQKLEEKVAGARVEVNQEKHHPADFALWKFSSSVKDGKVRDMEWESPWGTGFPGWHIECSAMAVKYLGQPFDIHASAIDHIPVHHENEIAQSEAAYGKPLAHYWLHGEFLLINGGRMGKSLGNAYTLADIEQKGIDPIAFRYFCLGAQYRSKLNFTWEALDGAAQALKHVRSMVARLEASPSISIEAHPMKQLFVEALEEDLNMPKALACLWDVLKSSIPPQEKRALAMYMDQVFGLSLGQESVQEKEIPAEIQALAERRWESKQKKAWADADALRKELEEKGWVVKDEANRFSLERK